MFVHPKLRVIVSRLNLEFDKGAVTEADVCNRGRVQEKPDLPEAFQFTVRTSLTGNEVRSFHKKIFLIGGDADLRGLLALFSLLLVDILSRSQFLPHPRPILVPL